MSSSKLRRPPGSCPAIAAICKILISLLPRDLRGPALPCRMATRALPGTPEKVEVLARRYRRRQKLFHRRDALEDDRFARLIAVGRNGRPRFVAVVKRTGQGELPT